MTKDPVESVQLSCSINMLLWFEFALFTRSRDMQLLQYQHVTLV